jgi:hypothetical protein
MSRCGTRSGYVAGCRCDACRAAHRDYNREWLRREARIRYGIEPPKPPRWIDATEVREHLAWLQSIGIGRRLVARYSGVSGSQITKLRDGITTRTTPNTANRILAVGKHHLPPRASIDATRTIKQLKELQKAGWTKKAIGQAITGNPECKSLQVSGPKVTVNTAEKVDALWRQVFARDIARRELQARQKAEWRARQAA